MSSHKWLSFTSARPSGRTWTVDCPVSWDRADETVGDHGGAYLDPVDAMEITDDETDERIAYDLLPEEVKNALATEAEKALERKWRNIFA